MLGYRSSIMLIVSTNMTLPLQSFHCNHGPVVFLAFNCPVPAVLLMKESSRLTERYSKSRMRHLNSR